METEEGSTTTFKVHLLSPAGARPRKIKVSNSGRRSLWSGKDVVAIIKTVCNEIPELQKTLQPFLEGTDVDNLDSVADLVAQYNHHMAAALIRREADRTSTISSSTRASKSLLKFIIDVSYQKTVNARKLNRYRAFSAATYGEASFKLVDQIVDAVRFKGSDVFVDMGSGVGKVVLQVAATTCTGFCWGIEKSKRRFGYAVKLVREFQQWMAWFGKECLSPFQLVCNDFTHQDVIQKITASATVVYANNLNFGEGINCCLAEHFKALRLGSRIVSGQGFVPPRFKLNKRTVGDLGAMVTLTPLPAFEDAVSWTSAPVGFFLHTKYRRPPTGKDDEDDVLSQASKKLCHSAKVWRPSGEKDDDFVTTPQRKKLKRRVCQSAKVAKSSKDCVNDMEKSQGVRKSKRIYRLKETLSTSQDNDENEMNTSDLTMEESLPNSAEKLDQGDSVTNKAKKSQREKGKKTLPFSATPSPSGGNDSTVVSHTDVTMEKQPSFSATDEVKMSRSERKRKQDLDSTVDKKNSQRNSANASAKRPAASAAPLSPSQDANTGKRKLFRVGRSSSKDLGTLKRSSADKKKNQSPDIKRKLFSPSSTSGSPSRVTGGTSKQTPVKQGKEFQA